MGKRAKLTQIICVDLECTCWKTQQGRAREIIEIGIHPLSLSTLTPLPGEALFIQPWLHPTLSSCCQDLTHIKQEWIDSAPRLEEVIPGLRERYGKYPWASWGDFDRKHLSQECKDKGLPFPFGPRHLNVKLLFALVYGLKREVGLGKAMRIAKIPFEGQPHRGVDDAGAVAQLLALLLQNGRAGSPC